MLEEITLETEAAASATGSTLGLLTVDCGATGSLLSMNTFEKSERSNLARVVKVDPNISKKYRVANGEVVNTDSQVVVTFQHASSLGQVIFDVTDQEGVPSLLGMNYE